LCSIEGELEAIREEVQTIKKWTEAKKQSETEVGLLMGLLITKAAHLTLSVFKNASSQIL